MTCTRGLPNVVTSIIHDITCTRALWNAITFTRALANVRPSYMTGIWKNVIKARGDTEKGGSAARWQQRKQTGQYERSQ